MNTIFLMPSDWDFRLDVDGNWAMAGEPYALAQDVASAIRLFDKELWYDSRKGVPHFDDALGKKPSYALYKHHLELAAKTVPGVVMARANIILKDGRALEGCVSFIDQSGKENNVQL